MSVWQAACGALLCEARQRLSSVTERCPAGARMSISCCSLDSSPVQPALGCRPLQFTMMKRNQLLRLALVALAAAPVCSSSVATETDKNINAGLNLGSAIEILRPDNVQRVKRLSG
jgi:hypothetical protein